MPELPEVETIVREMRSAGLVGKTIERAIIFWDRSIAGISSLEFKKCIAHQTIKDIDRRGKFIVFSLTKDTLLVHLRMTGKFLIAADDIPATSHERVRLYLDDGSVLRFEDQRKFGKWYLSSDPQKLLDRIGLEPLSKSFTLNAFKAVLKGRRKIKPLLLDQHLVAGIGNIYADEALWLAKIHPLRSIESLAKKEIADLHKAIIFVLTKGIDNIGTSLGSSRANYYSVSGRRGNNQNSLNVFRNDGLPCPRCQTVIQKIVVAQRGTHFCPHCQTLQG